MKRLSKRLVSVLLAMLLIITSLPIFSIPAVAADNDAESKLVAALESFENDVMKKIGTDGYGGLKTHLYDAYQIYYAAYQVRQDGTAEEMDEAREALEDAVAEMEEFVEPTANTAVKIGTGTSQPTADDYSNVLYSDGENAAFTNSTSGSTSQYGTTGFLGINWEYENYYKFYFPNTVILYDGKTNPKIPIVVGVTGNGSNATLMPQNIYLNSNYFEVNKNWQGTTEGGYAHSTTRYKGTPMWPDLDLNGGSYLSSIISYRPANRPYVALDEYNDGRKRWASEGGSNYLMFRNSIVYSLAGANEPEHGYSSVDSVQFMGEGTYVWKPLVNDWAVKGHRSMEPCDYTYTKTHVLNYKLIRTNLQALVERNQENFKNLDYIRSGALMTIARAIQLATAFDPNRYDYASGMATAAQKAGDDIDDIVAKLMSATLDDVDAMVATLDEVIHRYEEKMSKQIVYTNMLDAYKLYQTAVEYRDALKYGGRLEKNFNPSISDLIYDFDLAIKDMKEVGTSSSYSYVSNQIFDGDNAGIPKTDAYKETFKNLIYAGHTPTRMRSWGGDTEYDTGNGVYLLSADQGQLGTTTRVSTYLYVPKAVAVYDGTNGTDANPFTVPVLLGYNVGGGVAVLASESRRSLYGYTSRTADLPFLYNWKTRTFAGQQDIDDYVPEPADETNYYVLDVNCKVKDNLKANWKNYSPTRTYIESASLNDILNVNSFAAAKDAVSKTTTFNAGTVSLVRNNHQGKADDPEHFYANVMQIKNPYTDSTKQYNQGWKYYYYKYTTIATGLYACDVADNVCMPTSKGTERSTTGSTNNLALYVINYKPVLTRVNAAAGLIKDAPLDISKFTEGGLEGYFEDMDKLTACSPNNTKRYEFDNDKYQSSDKFRLDDLGVTGYTSNADGYVASTEQCAYDIWALLDSNTEDALQHLKDDNGGYTYVDDNGDTHVISKENVLEELNDTRNEEGGDYSDLKEQLDEKSDEQWEAVGTCQSGVYWNAYEAAVNAGRAMMSNVANPIKDGDTVIGHDGYKDQTTTYTYKDDENNDVTVNVTSVEDMAVKIEEAFNGLANAEKRTRHQVKFDHRAGDKTDRAAWDTGVFICNNDNSHKWLYKEDWEEEHEEGYVHNTADMGVYDALQFAYTTIDFERYSNDLVITSGKVEFDKVMTDVGAPGEEPQEMVDEGITKLLTAINTANDTKYSVTYPVEFDIVTEDGTVDTYTVDELYRAGTFTVDMCKFDDSGKATEILYGTTVPFTVPTEYAKKVYKWEIWTDNNYDGVFGDCNTKLVKDGNESGQATTSTFYLTTQCPVRVRAFIMPTAGENEVLVKVQNQYGKAAYAFAADQDTEVTNADGTLTIGTQSFSKDDIVFSIPNYTVDGFGITVTDEKHQLKDFAKDGVVEIPLNYHLTNESKTFKLTYNGKVIKEGIKYDEKVNVRSEAGDDFVAIAMKNNASDDQVFDYLPISYTKSFDYFAVCDMELVDITSPDMTDASKFNLETFYITTGTDEGGQPIKEELDLTSSPTTYDDMDYYRFAIERRKTKMPFVYATMEKMSETNGKSKYAVHSYFTNVGKIGDQSAPDANSQAATFVEAGTIFTTNPDVAASKENFKEGVAGVTTFKADKIALESYYYITASSTKKIYARSYVKYKYQFVNSHDEGSTDVTEIEAVIYGDVIDSENNVLA